ncbi:hypothetical protein TIFTF001_050419 [Ficus carica]|uniref:Uncharacterized protein n=1 Tax=Ficus carica TaxID=3494 RepID=A0AA88CRA6_FICCA|nr:hypothetical protein TIFTF001_050419 [Ficus carica]
MHVHRLTKERLCMKWYDGKQLSVSYRPALGWVGLWIELEWTGRHHQFIVARPVSSLAATPDTRWRARSGGL